MRPLPGHNPTAISWPPFELKGSLFTLTVMRLRETDQAAIDRHLGEKIREAPAFFNNAPVVIDLEAMAAPDARIDFAGLYDLLRSRGLIPVGVRNANPDLQAAAVLAGLPPLSESRSVAPANKPDKPPSETAPAKRNRLITQPVRSGQQIYAPEGDLILLGPISEGAEVLADGNIHIYGTLRGRALAGVKGDSEARIFCQSLKAQLVSIAGSYRVLEELEAEVRGKPVHVRLEDDRLIIEPLSR
jgi:septum site-determining protein MinC